MMNAGVRAWELLGEDDYTRLLEAVLGRGGVVVQSPSFFLAFVVEDATAVVWFACGELRELLGFARANAAVFGFSRVGWNREWAGKHRQMNFYSIEQLRR